MIESILQSVENGNPDYKAIADFRDTFIGLPIEQQDMIRQPLEILLKKQKINQETIWIMSAFNCNTLLLEALNNSSVSGLINLNFIPNVAGINRSTIHYMAEGEYPGELISSCQDLFKYRSARVTIIDHIINNLYKFKPISWSFAPSEGSNKGKSVMWWVTYHQGCNFFPAMSRPFLLSKKYPELTTPLNINEAPTEGSHQGSLLWQIVKNGHFCYLDSIFRNYPGMVTQLNWGTAPTTGIYKNESVMLWLMIHEKWDMVEKLLDKDYWDLFEQVLQCNNDESTSMIRHNYSGVEVNTFLRLIRNKRWPIIKLMVLNPKFNLIGNSFVNYDDPLVIKIMAENPAHLYRRQISIYSYLQQCEDLDQSIKFIKTYLLCNHTPTAIPNNCQIYQKTIEQLFELIAVLMSNERDKNPFNELPRELKDLLLEAALTALYLIDPQLEYIPLKQLKRSFDAYAAQRESKLQNYAYEKAALITCRFFQAQQSVPEVANWLKVKHQKENASREKPTLFVNSERKKFYAEIKKQEALTEKTVEIAFSNAFKP